METTMTLGVSMIPIGIALGLYGSYLEEDNYRIGVVLEHLGSVVFAGGFILAAAGAAGWMILKINS